MQLKRTVGVGGAVLLGLGSIVGTGIFVSLPIAYATSGAFVLPAVLIAACVAVCNGLSSAQLAAAHPVSGGTYEYGYRLLNGRLGFTAGWMFLIAKSASAATAALGFSTYLLQDFHADDRWPITGLAAGVVIALTVMVLSGLRRSNRLNAVLVCLTVGALLAFVGGGLPVLARHGPHLYFNNGVPGLLESTALMFVAYTGYGRIATMGEEITEPRRNIPRAMIVTLATSALLYAAVAFVLVGYPVRPSQKLGWLPLQQQAAAFGPGWIERVVGLGAMLAMLGVLLNLVLGLSRVWLAMGRRGDMPGVLARVNPSGTTPVPAVIVTGLVILGLVLIGDVKKTWSFSAFTVLVYYAITNAAALRLPAEQRRYPRALAVAGLLSCLFLAFWVEWQVWAIGLGLIVLGLLWHALARRASKQPGATPDRHP
ncbi:MAG: APC family permease [Planctomycetes bacterium]|nr:APC family permease [Planctomycetota bacterium]